jgi:hypothetical protein
VFCVTPILPLLEKEEECEASNPFQVEIICEAQPAEHVPIPSPSVKFNDGIKLNAFKSSLSHLFSDLAPKSKPEQLKHPPVEQSEQQFLAPSAVASDERAEN